MALYDKQDFNPPMLSRKWIAMQVRPNMLVHARQQITCILESGLLFREDSAEVEQEGSWPEPEQWLTPGEKAAGMAAVGVAIALFPPRHMNGTALLRLATSLSLPLAVRALHRRLGRGALQLLLARMRDYLALARRAAACLKECSAFRAQLDSVSSVLQSMHSLLCRQQGSLAVTLARCSSALLGNAPWLRADLEWDALPRLRDGDLLRIHHAFLVVQSSLLKHIALAHCPPSPQARRLYRHHNERIYWLHTALLSHLADEFQQNYEALERMYRLLKNYGNSDTNVNNKRPGAAIKDSWLYSDVHGGIARANLELKLALSKSHELDVFLDSCALNKHEIDLDILNKDIDGLIDHITTCLTTVQSSQMRLKKLKNKFGESSSKSETTVTADKEEEMQETDILKIEPGEPETKDEVFYLVKTEDDNVPQSSGDTTTAPGKKERETTKIVLNELRRKLVRREDIMRERERQALAKSMPDRIAPEFPRQINMEYADKKGYITKIPRKTPKRRLFRNYKIKQAKSIETMCRLKKLKQKINKYTLSNIISKESSSTLYEDKSTLSVSKFIKSERCSDTTVVTECCKHEWTKLDGSNTSWLSEGLSDVENNATNKVVNQAVNLEASLPDEKLQEANNTRESKRDLESESVNLNQEIQNSHQKSRSSHQKHENTHQEARNYRFSKRDLEITSSSESESDFEAYKVKQVALLKDIRRHRAARKKNHPDRRATPSQQSSTMDESLRPVEYSLGAGLAMASVLRTDSGALGLRSGPEEQFLGDGEVSADSGNDD